MLVHMDKPEWKLFIQRLMSRIHTVTDSIFILGSSVSSNFLYSIRAVKHINLEFLSHFKYHDGKTRVLTQPIWNYYDPYLTTVCNYDRPSTSPLFISIIFKSRNSYSAQKGPRTT